MNKLFFALSFLSISLTANEAVLLSKRQIKTINTPHLVLTKSKASDAPDFIKLVSQYDVSRFMFCSEASEEKIKKLAKSTLITKIMAPLMLKHEKMGGSFWMIKNAVTDEELNNKVIGFVGLTEVDSKIKKVIRSIDRQNYKYYMNIGVSLEPGEWDKGYAKESMCALASTIFASKKFKNLKGLVISVNSEHQQCLNTIMQDGKTKEPLVYQGEVHFPNGFSKLVPTPCTVKNFTITKDSFIDWAQTNTVEKQKTEAIQS